MSGGKMLRLPNYPVQAWAGKVTSAGFHKCQTFCHLFIQKAHSRGPPFPPNFPQGKPEAALRHRKDSTQLRRFCRAPVPISRKFDLLVLSPGRKIPPSACGRQMQKRKRERKNGGRMISESTNIQVTYNKWTNKNFSRKVAGVLRWWCWRGRRDLFFSFSGRMIS